MVLQLDCCGIKGPNDWQQVFNNSTLPESCCSEIPTNETCTKVHAHPKGCSDKLLSLLNENVAILAAVATAVALVQVSFDKNLVELKSNYTNILSHFSY